jgi:signal peptide peptidase SppA
VSDPYRHITAFALDHPWAIQPQHLEIVAEVLARRIAGQRLTADELEARLQDKKRLPQGESVQGGVAVIPIHGVITPRGNMLDDVSGATSLDMLQGQLDAAMASDKVGKILLDIDSPGGSVAGVTEFARSIMRARAKKPVIAHARYTAASAALWIGAAATKFVASPSARVGSLGVYAIHNDLSKALEAVGVKRSFISSSAAKVEGNEAQPLSDGARAEIQKVVDASAARFRQDVAHGRSVTVADVKEKFGEGRMFNADEALSAGLIDEIATYEDTVSRLLSADASSTVRGQLAESQPAATAQEPLSATAQERRKEALEFERLLFEASL